MYCTILSLIVKNNVLKLSCSFVRSPLYRIRLRVQRVSCRVGARMFAVPKIRRRTAHAKDHAATTRMRRYAHT